MKIFRSLLLAGFLFITPCFAQAPTTPPAQVFELNAGMCSARSLGLYHAKMDGKKLVLDYYVDSDGSVVKDTDPLVFDYVEEKSLEGGAVPFTGSVTLEGHDVEIAGLKYKDRVAALVAVDGHIVYVFYGVGGPLDDLVKVKDAATESCQFFLTADDLKAAMLQFLHGADAPSVAPDPDVKKT